MEVVMNPSFFESRLSSVVSTLEDLVVEFLQRGLMTPEVEDLRARVAGLRPLTEKALALLKENEAATAAFFPLTVDLATISEPVFVLRTPDGTWCAVVGPEAEALYGVLPEAPAASIDNAWQMCPLGGHPVHSSRGGRCQEQPELEARLRESFFGGLPVVFLDEGLGSHLLLTEELRQVIDRLGAVADSSHVVEEGRPSAHTMGMMRPSVSGEPLVDVRMNRTVYTLDSGGPDAAPLLEVLRGHRDHQLLRFSRLPNKVDFVPLDRGN